MDKKGQGLSVNTIILIVLGIFVLVILIAGFALGWKRVMPWVSPPNNVNEIADQCKVACGLEQKYAYCFQPRILYAENNEKFEGTTCYILAKKKAEYGIDNCLAAACDIADDLAAATGKCKDSNLPKGAIVKYIDDSNNNLKIGSHTCP